ncbi:MAG TPA: efflux RND transporter periplasmic adaptor subunit [Bryobacteraceae bacterium]|nr:efflux RND transporter periplasmic adaptor subunit [Bryobacteraceae bacterium]
MKKLWFLLVIPVVLLIWWVVDMAQSAPAVHYATVKRETIESVVSTNGKLEPEDFAEARAEIAGVVNQVSVKRGQQVKQGDPLVILDSASEQAAVNTARAQLAEAKAEENAVRSGGKLSARTDYEERLKGAQLALADAQRRKESFDRLYAKQAATKEEKLAADAALANAQQQVNAIKANQNALVSPADRNTTAAKLKDAQAGLELAQHRLSLTTIRAPVSGTVYQFDLKQGTFLQVGTLVALIGNLDQMRVRVYVDEPDLGRVALNMPVTITWQARPGQVWQGHVTQTPTEVTALQSRQVGVVTCIIENPNHDLLPGTNIDANIISKVVQNVLSIPKQALQTTASGAGVWKLDGNIIHWQAVTAGVSNIADVEIKSGLAQGDRVVLPSDATLENGMHVNATPQ